MKVNIIKGTDKQFSVKIVNKSSGEPFDLTGIAGANLALKMPGESADLNLTLTANANGSVLTVPNPVSGRIVVSISDLDTAELKEGESQGMELTINEGAGPDYEITKVQFTKAITVKKSLFA